MSLILQRLTATPAAVRRQRAQIIDSQLRNKQLELISNLRSKCDAIELQINQLTDIAPSSTTSLKMEAVDAQNLVENLQSLSTELTMAKVDLEVAEKNYKTWFAPDNQPNVPSPYQTATAQAASAQVAQPAVAPVASAQVVAPAAAPVDTVAPAQQVPDGNAAAQ